MGKYVVRRLLMMIPTFLGATLIIFYLSFALPGDPTAGRCGERPCPASYVEWFRSHYGLDKPFLVQYGIYMGRLLTGDLGTNYYGNTVIHELAIRYPTTLKLAVIAIVAEILIGIGAGILAGIRRGRFIDSLVTISTLVVIAIPVFVLGSLAQMVFGIKLKWFPVTAGDGTWGQLLLPGLVLGSLYVAYVARLTRTNLVENLRADYVRTAYAKGMQPARAIGLHALRNSLLPSITYIGASFGALLGGAIVTERIFNINGVGSLIYRSISQRDGTTLVGAVVVIVVIYMVMTLLVDLLYGLLDPRLRHE
ncbi:MAG: ABC transporter permease [Propionibacteriaceae bacterium]|jgi:oligopeptide transport system permease protein|nr:ABC transporter permease [Propionibacteriaceae bacterium]